MNTAIKCIVLLACIICSSTTILNCRCVRTVNATKISLIADVDVINPRPYCNRKEVIAVLKDGSSQCLNPNGKFTQLVVKAMLMKKAARASKKTSTSTSTSTPKTTIASVT
ncbi:permeability factor 2-like [Sebastes umbrosus]|uniref:permeability factor 2-like n=1 Tax=Sebastes umbrosus TaxID=72105 RepID=UPI0018A110DB|nr:permeability factor 2-like [Sebastes umbrosus]